LCSQRGFLPKIQSGGCSVVHPHDQEPASADVAGLGHRDGKCEGGRYGGIRCIAALTHHIDTHM
jgi:hypothetical protein